MTRDEIYKKTCDLALRREVHGRDDQKIRHFSHRLASEDDADVFEALFRCFTEHCSEPRAFDRQEIAGTLLGLRRPVPTQPLRDILLASAANWDVSVEQFPWYLCLHFGREQFRCEVKSMLSDATEGSPECIALGTCLYWTERSEKRMAEELETPAD